MMDIARNLLGLREFTGVAAVLFALGFCLKPLANAFVEIRRIEANKEKTLALINLLSSRAIVEPADRSIIIASVLTPDVAPQKNMPAISLNFGRGRKANSRAKDTVPA